MERTIVAGEELPRGRGYNSGKQAGGERGTDSVEEHGEQAGGAGYLAVIGGAQRYGLFPEASTLQT